MEEPINLELAKKLKSEGYSKPCEFYWQGKDYPYSPSGLKKIKANKRKVNHNRFDDFYSAPMMSEAVSWLHGKK